MLHCCHFGARYVHTIHAQVYSPFIRRHIRRVHVLLFLAVTCHLHFRQNDRDLSRATAVTRGWNGYRNKSQHRKLTLEKNKIKIIIIIIISGRSCQDSNPRPFDHESGALPLSHPRPPFTLTASPLRRRNKANTELLFPRYMTSFVYVKTIGKGNEAE